MSVAPWTQKEIEEARARIQREAAAYQTEDDGTLVLNHLKQRTYMLSQRENSESRLDLLFTVLTSLKVHTLKGGLTSLVVERLFSLAFKILEAKDPPKEKAKLIGLFGELHASHPLSDDRSADLWHAHWNQPLLSRLGSGFQTIDMARCYLNLAIRFLRRGYCRLALEYFQEAEASDIKALHFETICLGRIKALRLLNRIDECKILINASLCSPSSSFAFLLELDWEQSCISIAASNDLSPLMELVQSQRAHYLPRFVLDAYFLAQAASSEKWRREFPRVRSLFRRPLLKLGRENRSLQMAMHLDYCQDLSVPLSSRLARVDKICREVGEVESLEHELLSWLTLSRCLLSQQNAELSQYCLDRYQSLSLQISEGQSRDILKFATDLLPRQPPRPRRDSPSVD